MAILIEITKIKTENDIHFYEVAIDSYRYTKPLVVAIDAITKNILFFLNNNLTNFVCAIDLLNLPESLKNQFFSENFTIRVFI
jgi:hypothetical protein